MSPPCWLDGRTDPDPKNIISCKNGLLDITTRKLIRPTPAFFTRTALTSIISRTRHRQPYGSHSSFEVMAQRPQLVRTIQEMIGYLISGDTTQQRVFYFTASARRKRHHHADSQSIDGRANVQHYSTVETLGGRFGS